ncbi:hypothetical protein RGQ29_000690 [Quercus rubra]|uniref:Low-temperature-induced protein n=1 Tax=Quercus rubra TaxID=3512 RepID=A0AAN7G435_QUERU|nr:hypothetical protein RGQ29_000690 [Quercus rubra]
MSLDRMHRYGDNPKSPTSPIFEQLLRGDGSKWSPNSSSPTFGRDHDPEEDHAHPQKKSVLTKVKEKAKKLRNTLSNKKRNSEDDNTTPSWGVSLDDYEDEEEEEEDAEYLGAPMYESELAPETYRETARQHPREIPVISEKHVLSSSVNCNAEQEKEKTTSPNKTITETVTERLAPAYAAISDATYALASKVQGLTVSTPAASQTTSREAIAPQPLSGQTVPQTYSGTSVLQTYSSTFAPEIGTHANTSEQIWDKGVSVKEYLMHKLEPEEDERALSQVISEAMSPRSRRTPGDIGVVEKVREAVTSLLWHEESPKYTAANSTKSTTSHLPISTNAHLAKNSASHIPISTNVHEVGEEENHGRILQAN